MEGVNEFGATVTLVRTTVDTVQTILIRPDGSVVGSTRVISGPEGPEQELSDDERAALARDLQAQIDAKPDDFGAPVLEAVVSQIRVHDTGYEPAPAAFDLAIVMKATGEVVATRTLYCNPAGGSHPNPRAACEQLSKVAGRIQDIPGKHG